MKTAFYVLKRLALAIAIFLVVTFLSFMLYNSQSPQYIATNLLPLGIDSTPEQIAGKIRQLGLDQPLIPRYFQWLGGFVRGDLGLSWTTHLPISATLATRIPVTLSLFIGTMVLTVVFGFLLGIWAARRGGIVDRALQLISVVLRMVPGFYLALLIVITFAITLHWFPATGFTPIQKSATGWLWTITLPTVSIAIGSIVGMAIWIRSNIIDLLRLDFVRTLRSRGISERSVVLKHVLRNAAAPTLTAFGLFVIGMLSGVVITERIFALPGLGQLALTAGTAGDVPTILDVTSFLIVVIVVVNLVVDLVNGLLNPKTRLT